MKKVVQAQLDQHAQANLDRLMQRLGWSPSKVARESSRLLAVCNGKPSRRKVIGVGRFASGVPDLGSSKKHDSSQIPEHARGLR